MGFYSFAILVFIFQFVHVAFSCNGYDVKVTQAISATGNNINILPNIYTKLTADCYLILDACLTVDWSFTNSTISFELKKEGMEWFPPFYSKKNENVCQFLANYKTPVQCPVATGRYCNTAANLISVKDYAFLLPLGEGNVKVTGAKIAYSNSTKVDSFDLVINIFKPKVA